MGEGGVEPGMFAMLDATLKLDVMQTYPHRPRALHYEKLRQLMRVPGSPGNETALGFNPRIVFNPKKLKKQKLQ